MRYPLDKSEFIEWVKHQSADTLFNLKIELLASQADLQIQLQNNRTTDLSSSWQTRARIKLRLTEWRLEVTSMLLDQGLLAFQRAAYTLLDRDTYDTILEAANATRIS